MFNFVVDKIHIFLVVYTVFAYAFIYFLYDIRYKRKYGEFSDEMHKQYIELLRKATIKAEQDAIINLINIERQEEFHDKCPYCKKPYEQKDLPTL